MDRAALARTRLRHTFRYPADDEDEAVEEGMDEQDQEQLISKLSSQDTSSTKLYTNFLLVLPLAPILLYTPPIFGLSTSIPSLAAILSLVASAYVLYFLPLPAAPTSILSTANTSPSKKGKSIARGTYGSKIATTPPRPPPPRQSETLPYLSDKHSDLVQDYLIATNGVICILLALYELSHRRTWSEGMIPTIGGGYVPGFIFSVILWARRELRVVDLGELERLRYRS